ncbi:hypothetical protein WICMUC_001228 [Wickerhamomyces mucosus]|uniref:Protein-lysine N-methyltransferase EFM3 n=1 Tax=Wickerhamomyces mucosus TaxID=1378264 RepID=A0A9P8PV83_9ASCO|nr:hypothetical protein WICMUC_001228 [Wickerhamomyces mucosus]
MEDLLIANLKQRVFIKNLIIPNTNLINESKLLSTLKSISLTNPYYVKQFLEILFQNYNNSELNLQDEFYEFFIKILNSKPIDSNKLDLITYSITQDISIDLNETPRIISGQGTTGLRTWEASFYLCEYLYNRYNNSQIDNKLRYGLELGAGTGLVSIFLWKLLQNDKSFDKKLYITDGDSNLLENLSQNLKLNNISIENEQIKLQRLWWGIDEIPTSDGNKADNIELIYAADVTYDISVIPDLIKCIIQALKLEIPEILIAATIRNEQTINFFENCLIEQQINWSIVSERKQGTKSYSTIWYSPETPDIRVYRIVKY